MSTKLFCSVCGNDGQLTIIQGTLICRHCLDKITVKTPEELPHKIHEIIIKENDMGDIYD